MNIESIYLERDLFVNSPYTPFVFFLHGTVSLYVF